MLGQQGKEISMNHQDISKFLQQQGLPDSYANSITNAFLPLAQLIARHCSGRDRPLLVGINGAQGTGKSTLTYFLEAALSKDHGLSVTRLSIDDFYLSQAQRQRLAEEVHPLLRTRGVPGTHDAQLLAEVIDSLQANLSEPLPIPRFDKATDNPLPRTQWPVIAGKVDLIILEGWFIGTAPQSEAALLTPVNTLEKDEDADLIWRRYVNTALAASYQDIFRKLDYLIMLQAPSFEKVFEWRSEQETQLAKRSGTDANGVMNPVALRRFIAHFERLTRHCLESIPDKADALIELDEFHRAVLKIPIQSRLQQ